MRYKLTFVVGLTLGYVLGTRAGRERHQRMLAAQLSEDPRIAVLLLEAGPDNPEEATEYVTGGYAT